MQIIPPELPPEAREELPAADTPYKKYRGTLAWWVIGIMFVTIIVLASRYDNGRGSAITELRKDNNKKDEKIDSLQNVITDMLKQRIYELRPVIQKARQTDIKTDSLINNITP